MAAVPPVSPFVTGGLFGVSALTGVLSFMSELKAANDHNEYINALKKAQERNASNQAAVAVEGLSARAIQTRKSAAHRLDELQRFARKGLAANQAAAAAGGVEGSSAQDAETAFKSRLSEKLAADMQNLEGDEEQIQRMLDAVPITQANSVDALQGKSQPTGAEQALGILGSYFSIKAKYGN